MAGRTLRVSREKPMGVGQGNGVMITVLNMVPHLPDAGKDIGSGVD